MPLLDTIDAAVQSHVAAHQDVERDLDRGGEIAIGEGLYDVAGRPGATGITSEDRKIRV